MTETVSVSVSGAAFSLLYFENIKSEYNQEGFLLGDIICKETNKLTDADHRVINKERIIKVKSIIPCPQQFYFYNASGKIDVEKLKTIVGDQESKVIGWYIYKRKRFSGARFTFREKLVHKQLAEIFRPPVPFFTCCMLTSENSNIKSTHSLCQTFIRYSMSVYESLPIHVVNLSDPNFTFKSAEPVSDTVSKVTKALRNKGDSEAHLDIQNVQDGLQYHMKNLVEEAVDKERQLFILEQKVKQLQYNLKLSREYGTQKNEVDDSSEKEITENGNDTSCSQNSQDSAANSSPEFSTKRRGRSRKNGTPVQSSVNKSPGKICDAVDDHLKENEAMGQPMKTRSKATFSYSEIAQKSKN